MAMTAFVAVYIALNQFGSASSRVCLLRLGVMLSWKCQYGFCILEYLLIKALQPHHDGFPTVPSRENSLKHLKTMGLQTRYPSDQVNSITVSDVLSGRPDTSHMEKISPDTRKALKKG